MPFGNHSTFPVFRSAFTSADDEWDPNLGRKPVVFDILAPDHETSLLPEGFRLVLHVNPRTMTINNQKAIERIQTKGGFVEQHWGEGARTIDFNMATGGFMRLYTGLSNITGGTGAFDSGGTRRETIAYDKYLDLLSLFHSNGGIYDTTGKLVFQGIIQVTFDGGIYLGYFSNFSVTEAAEKPYSFEMTTQFLVDREIQRFHSAAYTGGFPGFGRSAPTSRETLAGALNSPKAASFLLGGEEG